MKVMGVIPARYASTRFPGKPLAPILGRPMIEYVYKGCSESTKLSDLVIATDDHRILLAVQSFGGKAVMTSEDHTNGTSRCEEVSRAYPEIDWVINIQGDEPLIKGALIDHLVDLIYHSPDADIITLVKSMDDADQVQNPNIVKCVFGLQNKALYFSRSPIPYHRNNSDTPYYQHIGIYAYKKSALAELISLESQPLESTESLEQLRWLECGYDIKVGLTDYTAHGVDTPTDIQFIESILKGH